MQAGVAVLGILEQKGVHEVVIDLSGVTGFDMQSVASWVGISRTAHNLGGRLVIINPSDAVGDVLDSAGIDWTRDPT